MSALKAVPVAHNDKWKIFVHRDLSDLQKPYTGPFKVLSRVTARVLEIKFKRKKRSVSIENLKPAYFLPGQEPEIL